MLTVMLLMIAVTCFPMGKKKERKVLDSWLGSSKHSLIVSWGPPQQTQSDGDGGEVLIYSNRVYSPPIQLATGGWLPATDYYHNRMMYVNDNNKIYSWRTSNTPNPPTRVDLDIYLHKPTY